MNVAPTWWRMRSYFLRLLRALARATVIALTLNWEEVRLTSATRVKLTAEVASHCLQERKELSQNAHDTEHVLLRGGDPAIRGEK